MTISFARANHTACTELDALLCTQKSCLSILKTQLGFRIESLVKLQKLLNEKEKPGSKTTNRSSHNRKLHSPLESRSGDGDDRAQAYEGK
jgi:hypothetical protein